jgi:hypothetical protein
VCFLYGKGYRLISNRFVEISTQPALQKLKMIAVSGSYIEECARIAVEPGVKYNQIVCSAEKFQAICSGTALTVFSSSTTFDEDAIKAELEFDSELISACWDLSEGCVVVADVGGSLHLVTPTGSLLFSKKIVAGRCY